MKQIIFIFLVIIPSIFLKSQVNSRFSMNNTLGVGLYINKTNDETDSLQNKINTYTSVVSCNMNYHVTNNWHIGIEIDKNDFLTENDSNNTGDAYNLYLKNSFLLVNTNERNVLFFANIGYSSQLIGRNYSPDYQSGRGVSFQIGIGYEYMINKYVRLNFQPKINYNRYQTFTNENNEMVLVKNSKTNYKSELLGVVFLAGIKFVLPTKSTKKINKNK